MDARELQNIVAGLKGDSVLADDGPVGKVADVYFDDERWAEVVGYAIVAKVKLAMRSRQ